MLLSVLVRLLVRFLLGVCVCIILWRVLVMRLIWLVVLLCRLVNRLGKVVWLWRFTLRLCVILRLLLRFVSRLRRLVRLGRVVRLLRLIRGS